MGNYSGPWGLEGGPAQEPGTCGRSSTDQPCDPELFGRHRDHADDRDHGRPDHRRPERTRGCRCCPSAGPACLRPCHVRKRDSTCARGIQRRERVTAAGNHATGAVHITLHRHHGTRCDRKGNPAGRCDSAFTAVRTHRFLWKHDQAGNAVAVNHNALGQAPETVARASVHGVRSGLRVSVPDVLGTGDSVRGVGSGSSRFVSSAG